MRGYDADIGAQPWSFDSAPLAQPTVVTAPDGKICQQIRREQRPFSQNDDDTEATSTVKEEKRNEFPWRQPQRRDRCLRTTQSRPSDWKQPAPRDIDGEISSNNVINAPRAPTMSTKKGTWASSRPYMLLTKMNKHPSASTRMLYESQRR
eukprot:g54879.t1